MKHILTLCLLLFSTSVLAIPAQRIKKTITLSDGTQKQVVLVGDENIHYYLDADNNAYTYDKQGVFVKNDRVKLEKRWEERLTLRNKHRLERAEARGMIMNPKSLEEQSFQRRAQWGAEQNPISGDKKGLVILVNFSDVQIKDAHDHDYYDDFFNEIGFSKDGNHGSVHDYFFECSYGQFNLTFDVYGPVTLSKSYSYYGQNDSKGYDTYPAEMVSEACTMVNELGADFSKYDWDGDGEVDQVFLVYAGYGEHCMWEKDPNTIWPHENSLANEAPFGDGNGPVSFDGVKVNTYAVASELDGLAGEIASGIGLACHEFSHCMCIPDFYDTTYTCYGMDEWDLMDLGGYNGNGRGNCPIPYTSYERMYCGWLTPTVLNGPYMVTGMKTMYETPEAYIIYNDANPDEYYMLENRQGEGFDACSPAKGLLVLHVYFDSKVWGTNSVNSTSMQRMTIIPADGVLSKDTNNGDTWPGIAGVTELSDTSLPASTLYTANKDGSKLMGKPIENIKDVDGKISFVFNGGVALDTPMAQFAAEVKDNGFTARWDTVEGASSYKVKLIAEDIEEQSYPLSDLALLQEDFSAFNNGKEKDGSTDVGLTLDNYTKMPGWGGEKLYTTPGNEVKLGSNRQNGYITSPRLNTDSHVVTLVFTVRQYGSDTEPVYVTYGEGPYSDKIKTIELTAEPIRHLVAVTVNSGSFYWGLESGKRCYISEMCAYEGRVTEEQIQEGIVRQVKKVTSIVETEGTSYEFTDLSNLRKYAYSVCAYQGEAHSKWGNTIEVILPNDETGIKNIDNSQFVSQNNCVYDLCGRRLFNSQGATLNGARVEGENKVTMFNGLKKGIYIVNGKKIVKP